MPTSKRAKPKSRPVLHNRCASCGMECAPGEFHPYAACLMFRGCQDAETVRDNLHYVRGPIRTVPKKRVKR